MHLSGLNVTMSAVWKIVRYAQLPPGVFYC